jgi:hypothetical protein
MMSAGGGLATASGSPKLIASNNYNEGKPNDHTDRVTSIINLMKDTVDPKISEIGEIRTKIRKQLTGRVRRTISESAPV